MAAEYRVRIYSRTGALVYELVDYTELAYTREVNSPGMAVVSLSGNHPVASAVDLDFQLEVWRRDMAYALDWYCDFYGLIRDVKREAATSGERVSTLYAPGSMSLLGRAIIAYPANTGDRNRVATEKAETILKAMVTYNATAAGTLLDGRVRAADLSTITVQANAAGGNTLDVSCAWENLLRACQDIASVGGGDFDLIKTGALTWDFRWYLGQRGTDKSATVVFSMLRGNMANPQLSRNTLSEKTVAIIGGQGEEATRSIAVRTGTNYEADYNSSEVFVDARRMTTIAGLEGYGDQALAALQARYSLEFDVIQTPASFYGVHYDLGDLVTASFDEYTGTKKIVGITISFSDDGEQIQVVMEDA